MSNTPIETTITVGTVVDAEPFPEANTEELVKLWLDLDDDRVQSAAQLGYNYTIEEVIDTQVLCATDLGTIPIAGFRSEVLTVGVPDEECHPVLVRPDQSVPDGGVLY